MIAYFSFDTNSPFIYQDDFELTILLHRHQPSEYQDYRKYYITANEKNFFKLQNFSVNNCEVKKTPGDSLGAVSACFVLSAVK